VCYSNSNEESRVRIEMMIGRGDVHNSKRDMIEKACL